MITLSLEQHRYIAEKAPWFIKAIAAARQDNHSHGSGIAQKNDVVTTAVDCFPDGDMFLVYACLLLAGSQGVTVAFQPKHKDEPHK